MKLINRRRLAGGIALLGGVVLAQQALAQTELVTNGSFETDLSGWTQTILSGGCDFQSATPGGGYWPGSSPAAAASGSRFASVSITTGGASCRLTQDVALPAGQTIALSLAAGVFSAFPGPVGTVRITDTAGVTLVPILSTGTNNPNLSPYTADLSAYAGQTVRISYEITTTSYQAAVNGDAVSIIAMPTVQPTAVPTMTEWAMILFGLILAGGAALMIQRRRFAL